MTLATIVVNMSIMKAIAVWDGLDCFNDNFPNCTTSDKTRVGRQDKCDPDFNTFECKWDGLDCLSGCNADPITISNGKCDEEQNTPECKWDGLDCLRDVFPDCEVSKTNMIKIGNLQCDTEYNNADCDWDGWDCISDCPFGDRQRIGDGECDNKFNIKECAYDGGDCIKIGESCGVEDPTLIGNRECDYPKRCELKDSELFNFTGNEYFDCNIDEYGDCKNDGGDCDVPVEREHEGTKGQEGRNVGLGLLLVLVFLIVLIFVCD